MRRAGGRYRSTFGFRKRIALQGGVAATVTPVTLLCATTLKTLNSLNKEVRPFSLATIAFRVIPLFLLLAITAFGGPEGYCSLAIIAFGAFGFIVSKY